MFFNHKVEKITEKSYLCSAEIDDLSPVFKGHFPVLPVVPGVYLVSLTSHFISMIENKKFMLKEASSIKFTAIVEPSIKKISLNMNILSSEKGMVLASLEMFNENKVFCKMKGLWHHE